MIDEEKLRELYHEDSLTQAEIAEKVGVHRSTISSWMIEAEIETRSPKEAANHHHGAPSLRHDDNGYEKFNGEETHFLHHRLLAVAEFGREAVVGKEVHHSTEIEWDNRPDNLELMETGEHISHHLKKTNFTDDLLMMELYHNNGKTQSEIGKLFGIGARAVSRRVSQ